MSDRFYKWVVRLGYPAFWVSGRPVVLHRQRLWDPHGAFILAPNHLSVYDVPCLMAQMPRWRLLDFVSITELFRNRLTAWFFGSLNAFPLDRSKADGPTVRTILDRLSRGRVVAMFAEGRIPPEADSVLNGGSIKPGVASLAQLAGVPVVPCVVLGTKAYSRFTSWLPLRRTQYGINFGEPIHARTDLPPVEARAALLQDLKDAYRSLHAELLRAMGEQEQGFWAALAAATEPQGTPAERKLA